MWRAILRLGILEPRTVAGWIVRHVHTPFDKVERASAAVAKGNLKVSEEIGEVFARSVEDSSFIPSEPLLRDASEHYRQAAILLKDLVCEIVSQGFMTLKLPAGRPLRLGDNLEAAMPKCFEGIEKEPLLAQFESVL